MVDDPENNPDGAPTLIRFDYIKSSLHRVIHADGVVGGPTGRGNLTATFFSERAPIPQQVSHAVVKDEATNVIRLGEEIQGTRIAREAIVREADVTVVMDLKTAQALHVWLGHHLETLANLQNLRQSKEKEQK